MAGDHASCFFHVCFTFCWITFHVCVGSPVMFFSCFFTWFHVFHIFYIVFMFFESMFMFFLCFLDRHKLPFGRKCDKEELLCSCRPTPADSGHMKSANSEFLYFNDIAEICTVQVGVVIWPPPRPNQLRPGPWLARCRPRRLWGANFRSICMKINCLTEFSACTAFPMTHACKGPHA